MKRILSILLSIFIEFTYISPTCALSNEEISAPSAILIEQTSGKVLFEKNSHEPKPFASITKIMTLLLVMEAIDSGKISINDMVSISEHAASMTGSHIWLKASEKMSVDDLIKATAVVSANDAACALAEHVCGSEPLFVEEMNKKAKELGMNDTTFKNCHGLDEDGHTSSAYDISTMAKELLMHKEIFKYTSIWMDYLRDGKTQLVSTNKLLRTYNGITGLKTGTTSIAKSCMAASATRNGLSLIGVVLTSPTTKDRFKDAASLLDFGFSHFSVVYPSSKTLEVPNIKVLHGMNPVMETQVDLNGSLLVPKGKEKDIKYVVDTTPQIEAPISEGQVVGTVTFTLDNEILAVFNITASSSVERVTFKSAFYLLIRNFLSM